LPLVPRGGDCEAGGPVNPRFLTKSYSKLSALDGDGKDNAA
jgi:hypothetical protein